MDITWEYETAAAERRSEFNAQVREDSAAVDETWFDLVSLFSREREVSIEADVKQSIVTLSSGVSETVDHLIVSSVITPRPSFFRRLFTLGA